MTQHIHANQSPLKELSLDAIVELLRANGMRITRNRLQILEALLRAEKPLSLDEIQTRVDGDTPDYATVFRVMTLLESLQVAQKVHLNRSCSYYELVNPQQHYDHIICTECGRVTVMIDSCPVEKVERKIEEQYGFSEIRHSLEFFGKCWECKYSALNQGHEKKSGKLQEFRMLGVSKASRFAHEEGKAGRFTYKEARLEVGRGLRSTRNSSDFLTMQPENIQPDCD